jgi:DNA-binding CsgD family transcriptional regulator
MLDELPPGDRRVLEGRLADAIERDAGDDVILLREALVHRRAASGPSADLALRLVRSRQRRLLSVEDLRLLGAISDELDPDRPDQVDLDRSLADLAAHAGDQGLAVERWTRVATHAPDASTRQAAAVEAARAANHAGQSGAAHSWLDRATREGAVDPEMSIRIDSIRADVYLWIDHRTTAGSRSASRAVETAERMILEAGGINELSIESRRAYLSALEAAADAALQLNRAAEIVRFGEASLLVAREIDEEAEVVALNRAAFALRPLGRVAEATELSRRAWDLSSRLILPSAMAEAGHTLARSLRDLGRIEEAHRIAIETVEIEARLRNPSRRWGNAANVLHAIELCADDSARALRQLREDARAEQDSHYRLAIHETIAEWLARSVGQSAAAEVAAELEAAKVDSSLAGCPRCAAQLSLVSAELLARIGRADDAETALAAEPAGAPEGHYMRSLWRSRADAAIALERGDRTTAVNQLAEIGDGLAKAGLLVELVWVWIDLGRANSAIDPDASRQAFGRAAELADQIGAVTLGRLATRALRSLGVRTWRRGQGAAGRGLDTLSDREHEVARLVASGNSNREIAESLDISPKTVERHMTNVLAKLGIRNRTELATLVQSKPVRDSPDE